MRVLKVKEGREEPGEVRKEKNSVMRMRREQQVHQGWEK